MNQMPKWIFVQVIIDASSLKQSLPNMKLLAYTHSVAGGCHRYLTSIRLQIQTGKAARTVFRLTTNNYISIFLDALF